MCLPFYFQYIIMSLESAIFGGLGSLLSSATSLYNSAANRAFSTAAQKREFVQQNKMYKQVRRDDLSDYAQQRKDYVNDLLMSRSRDVQALQNAGLSTSLAGEQSVGGNALGASIQQASFPSVNSIANSAPYQIQSPNLMFAAQLDNLKADTDKKNAETAKTKTEAERAKAEFENWQKVQRDVINDTMLATLSKLNSDKNKAWYESNEAANQYDFNMQEVDEVDENGKPTGNKIRRYEQIMRGNFKKLQAEVDTMTFNYEKMKEFKPFELKKLQEDINQVIENTALIKDKDKQQQIINRFNEAGIGVGSGLIDQIAALLYSGKGAQLGSQAVDTVVDFVKGFFSSLFDQIKKVTPW